MRPVSTEKKMFRKRHKQQKKTIKNIITKKTTQQEESPEKKKKNKKTTTNNKNEHIKSKPGFPKFLFLFFVCLCCCFVTLCFLFFYVVFSCFWFSSLILFVCSVAFYLFIQLYIICAVGLITQDIWTLLRHQKVSVRICQDGCAYWQNLKMFFLTTFDCSWRCNHCQSARYPGKKYKFFAGERRYSH